MARQLINLPGSLNLSQPRYNPRPPGVIRQGSATESVLQCLQAHPGQFLTHNQIMFKTRRTQKALTHGLSFLRALGLVEVASDEGRNQRYLRYRAVTTLNTRTTP